MLPELSKVIALQEKRPDLSEATEKNIYLSAVYTHLLQNTPESERPNFLLPLIKTPEGKIISAHTENRFLFINNTITQTLLSLKEFWILSQLYLTSNTRISYATMLSKYLRRHGQQATPEDLKTPSLIQVPLSRLRKKINKISPGQDTKLGEKLLPESRWKNGPILILQPDLLSNQETTTRIEQLLFPPPPLTLNELLTENKKLEQHLSQTSSLPENQVDFIKTSNDLIRIDPFDKAIYINDQKVSLPPYLITMPLILYAAQGFSLSHLQIVQIYTQLRQSKKPYSPSSPRVIIFAFKKRLLKQIEKQEIILSPVTKTIIYNIIQTVERYGFRYNLEKSGLYKTNP